MDEALPGGVLPDDVLPDDVLPEGAAGSADVIVVGCGRFGAHLAAELDRSGLAVVVIDRDASAFAALGPEFRGARVAADFLGLSLREPVGIPPAAVALAVTSEDDVNLAAALVCRKTLETSAVAARIDAVARADSWRELRIETVCPAALAAAAILERIESRRARRGGATSGHRMHPRPVEKDPGTMRTSLFVVVVGCGRLGSHLASQLSRSGHRVVVIDREESSFAALSAETFSGFRVEGDASEPAVLRRAKVDEADLLIAATSEDNLNIMVALVAKRVFGVKNVMARVYDPKREAIYGELGLDTVCPTIIATEAFFRIVEKALEARKGADR